MDTYTVTPIGEKTWLITERGFDAMYYLEGDKRGLLIDTGVGMGDLKSVVDGLAQKPYDVVLTHGHYDHMGGVCQFDRVYMHEKDFPLIEMLSDEIRRSFIENYAEMSEGRSENASAEEMPKGALPEFLPLPKNGGFSLGGRAITFIWTPGHTAGSVCLHDSLTKMLFVGDTIIYRLLLLYDGDGWGPAQKARMWKAATVPLYRRLNEFSALYMGHVGRADDAMVAVLPRIMDEVIASPELITDAPQPVIRRENTQVWFGMPF